MKWLLISSLVFGILAIGFLADFHQASATPYNYNNTAFSIPWTVINKNSSYMFFESSNYNGTIESLYNVHSGIMTKIIGTGVSSATLAHTPIKFTQNASRLYYIYSVNGSSPSLQYVDTITGSEGHAFTGKCDYSHGTQTYLRDVYVFQGFIGIFCFAGQSANEFPYFTTALGGNITGTLAEENFASLGPSSNMKDNIQSIATYRYDSASSIFPGSYYSTSSKFCEITYTPTNATEYISNPVCDLSIPNHSIHYWHGLLMNGINEYTTNSTYAFFQNILTNPDEKMLTLNSVELGLDSEYFTDFIIHNGITDYMVAETPDKIYYTPISTINYYLNQNRAIQTYDLVSSLAPTQMPSQTYLNTTLTISGPPGVNSTISSGFIQTLVSPFVLTAAPNTLQPYTGGGSNHVVRILDPQWTNNNNLIPVTMTYNGQTLFQNFLTVSNAPTDAGLMTTNPYNILNYTYPYSPKIVTGPNMNASIPLQGNLTDVINSVTLNSHGTASYTKGPVDYNTQSLSLTGSNYYVEPSNQTGEFEYNQSFSVCYWQKTGFTTSGGATAISHTISNSPGPARGWFINYYFGRPLLDLVSSYSPFYFLQLDPSISVADGQWHNICWVYAGNSTGKGSVFYEDKTATQFNSNTDYGSLDGHTIKANVPLAVGGFADGANAWIGDLAFVQVYNYALTQAQVDIQYANTMSSRFTVYGTDGTTWGVTRMDSTRSAEFDTTPGVCSDIWIADISEKPAVYSYQGSSCATGSNTKTIAYTSTLPFTFWTLEYGASDSYVPSNNQLTTYFHSNTGNPVTYNVLVKNSTGAIAINQTETFNGTLDTRTFNVSSVTKPAGLFISVAGSQIYSSYLGSSVSFASVASFFQEYFTYDGFSLLSIIPIVFASMFTRNTVGIGVVLTVVCIATISWLSIVVIPDLDVAIMMFIAIIGLIAYRTTYY